MGTYKKMERVMGIEPTRPAWKAGILPLNYTRKSLFVFCPHIIAHKKCFVNTFFGIFSFFIRQFFTLCFLLSIPQSAMLTAPFAQRSPSANTFFGIFSFFIRQFLTLCFCCQSLSQLCWQLPLHKGAHLSIPFLEFFCTIKITKGVVFVPLLSFYRFFKKLVSLFAKIS